MTPEELEIFRQMANDVHELKKSLALPAEIQGSLLMIGVQVSFLFLSIIIPVWIIRRAARSSGGDES